MKAKTQHARARSKGFLVVLVLSFVMLYNAHAYALSLNWNATLGTDKGFVMPAGITTDGTDAFVADYGANTIYKITTATKTVTSLITGIDKPVSLAYRLIDVNNKYLYITSESGGVTYNVAAAPAVVFEFGKNFSGVDEYKNIKKPADVAFGGGNVYVLDTYDYLIKIYNGGTGAFVSSIDCKYTGVNNGKGQMYLPSSIYYDTTTNRLVVSDAGNSTVYYQATARRNPFTKQMVTSTKLYGKPKGKVQVYDTATTTWKRAFLTSGSLAEYGQTTSVSGVWGDASYLFLADSMSKKILITDNIASDVKVLAWSSLTTGQTPVYNFQTNTANEKEPIDLANQTGQDTLSGKTLIQYSAPSALITDFALLKDIVKVTYTGTNYLVVTDKTGKVHYFIYN